MTGGSLRMRLLAAACGSVLLAVVVAGLALAQLFEGQVRERVERELANHLRQLIAAVEVSEAGQVSVGAPLADPRFEEPLSGLYWIVEPPKGEALRSRSAWDGDIVLPPRAPQSRGTRHLGLIGPDEAALIAAERTVTVKRAAGKIPLRLVVAVASSEVSEPVASFERSLVLFVGVLAVLLAVSAWVQVRIGLKPLETVSRRMADVRAGRNQRLDGDYPSEILPLVEEVNRLLASQETSLQKARARRRPGPRAQDAADRVKRPRARPRSRGAPRGRRRNRAPERSHAPSYRAGTDARAPGER